MSTTSFRMRALPIVAVLVLATSTPPVDAQTLEGGRHRFTVLFGLNGSDQRDEAVSPLRYRGWGVGGSARYDVETPRSRTVVATSILTNHLNRVSASSTPGAGDELGVALAIRHLRLVNGSTSSGRVFLGGALEASVRARTQQFVSGYHTDHLAGVIALAPALRLEWDRGTERTVSYDAAVPVLTGLIRSYADVHGFFDAVERSPVWKGPYAARAFTQSIAYCARLSRSFGLRLELHNELFDYSIDPAHGGVRTSAGIGFTWWTRRAS